MSALQRLRGSGAQMEGPGLGGHRERMIQLRAQVWPSKRMLGIKVALGSENPHPRLDLFEEETLESI